MGAFIAVSLDDLIFRLKLKNPQKRIMWRACNLTVFNTVPLVQWSTRLLPVMRDPGEYLCKTGILLLALSRYIGDPKVIDHCGLLWGKLCPEPSLGRQADNVIIPLDLTQLFCPAFTLATGPPSSFTTNIVGCWGGALCRACNLTLFIDSSTGPVVHPFASYHEGPRFNPQGKPRFSC